jgi:hypothetical protein
MEYSKCRLIKETLCQRSKWSALPFSLRYLYMLKTVLCILLGLLYTPIKRDSLITGVAKFGHNRVSWHPDPNVFMWSELAVGPGLIHNWYYDVFSNTTPNSDALKEGNQNVLYITLGKLQDL